MDRLGAFDGPTPVAVKQIRRSTEQLADLAIGYRRAAIAPQFDFCGNERCPDAVMLEAMHVGAQIGNDPGFGCAIAFKQPPFAEQFNDLLLVGWCNGAAFEISAFRHLFRRFANTALGSVKIRLKWVGTRKRPVILDPISTSISSCGSNLSISVTQPPV